MWDTRLFSSPELTGRSTCEFMFNVGWSCNRRGTNAGSHNQITKDVCEVKLEQHLRLL